MHWRALIELLGLMPVPKREALCNLQFPVVSGPALGSPGGPPAVGSVVDQPEVPMDWTSERVASGGAVKRVLGRGQGVEQRTPATGAYGFSAPRPVPLFSLNPVPSPRLASMGRGIFQSVVGGHREEDHQVREESPVLVPDAMDSHLHLDRALRRLRLEPSTGIQEFMARCSAPAPRQRVNLVGGVLVFCDPKTWPKDPEKLRLPEGFVVAVGVHPKQTNTFGDCYFDQLSRLVDSRAVTALGEVGLDCIEGAKPFAVQYSTLLWVLALARPYMPLVLHVRASEDSLRETAALYRRVLGAVLEKVPNSRQGIHLHCFDGDSVTVKLWLDSYPETYFGFTMTVKGFGEGQRLGLKSVPSHRLLLESDSPHLPDVAGSVNHPGRLFRVAEEVARVRDQSPWDVLRAGLANGRSLYRRK